MVFYQVVPVFVLYRYFLTDVFYNGLNQEGLFLKRFIICLI